MASRKSFLTNQSYIFPTTSKNSQEDGVFEFEFDEAELWNSCTPIKKGGGNSNSISGLKRATRKVDGRVGPMGPASLPVNIPNWSKILKEEHKEHRKWESDDDDDEEDGDHEDERDQHRVPPHEYLARTRGASFSMQEGIGRTLKGRDLRSVRNAIWKQVGFED
ncbi:hypothetical protein TSUD_29130 [Trifolium subterraneum]|uniref:Senescence regulator S40 n=1 Tax=Trifolium subterraneum TaxID=3900 RepID=A0A2Z6NWZ6_TRISU|nr:hypothetical protein TSUD_29130 [Trifolium subterraneum]